MHLYKFGCKTYTHDFNKNKLDKLEPKAYIKWLVR